MDLTKLTIKEIYKGISEKKFSFFELNQAYFENFKKYNKLNFAISEYWDQALNKAKELDKMEEKDFVKYPLLGLPIAVKDLFLTKGQRTTAASKVLDNFVAPYESFVTQKMLDAGYILPFKTNLDEFAMGSSNENSAYGCVINPWIGKDGVLRSSGGSSGGSAASVAAHCALAATGTDTGGSIRQPASFCGITGFKPTYGRCSRKGVIAFASSLDHPGILTKTVEDACIIMDVIAGYDEGDSTSIKEKMLSLSLSEPNLDNKTIGIIDFAFEGMSDEYLLKLNNLIKEMQKEGAKVQSIDIDKTIFETALKIYFIIAPAEASSNLSRYDGIRFGNKQSGSSKNGSSFEEILQNTRSLFQDEVKRRILIGNFVTSSDEYEKYFGKANKIRQQITITMENIFQKFDALLLPTTSSYAFPIGMKRNPVEIYRDDLYTTLANIYQGPAISIPFANINLNTNENISNEHNLIPSESLPVGLQIIADKFQEFKLCEIAKGIENIIKGSLNV